MKFSIGDIVKNSGDLYQIVKRRQNTQGDIFYDVKSYSKLRESASGQTYTHNEESAFTLVKRGEPRKPVALFFQ